MAKTSSENLFVVDGSFDWTGGVDSSKVTTIRSDLTPNGVARNQLVWLNNANVRTGGIIQRPGWQPLVKILDGGRYQGGYLYEPDGGNPYLVCSIWGHIYKVLCEPPYTVTDLSVQFGLTNPPDAEMAFFVQGENFLIIQAGDFFTGPIVTPQGGLNDYGQPLAFDSTTLPLFWDGTTLRRSRGITTLTPSQAPGQNEIPAATCMDYYGGRLWYAQNRQYSAGDIVGGPSGTAAYRFRDAILNVTENPLCFGGDGFTVPTNAGNIRAIRHSANLDESMGEGQLYIFTRKSVYSLSVPVTRLDWINANADNAPKQTVAQLVNGAAGHRSVVPINGDLFYQAFDPSIRSLITARRYFAQWGNTPISQNEQRAVELNNRALMRFSGAVEFDNRILNLWLPQLAADGINVIHKAILPLDFDIVSSLEERKSPVWEGAYDGLDWLELYSGDFGGLPRCFGTTINEDLSINVWELTTSSRTQNGDNRLVWSPEFPAFTWAPAGLEYELKQLTGGEMWVDKVSGTVDIHVYYRPDADPCWRLWFYTQICTKRCEDEASWDSSYPCEPFREGYVFPVVFPEPKQACNAMGIRPSTIGYQFQVKVMLKGWCRIRGLLLHAMQKQKAPYHGVACPPTGTPVGMASLPPHT